MITAVSNSIERQQIYLGAVTFLRGKLDNIINVLPQNNTDFILSPWFSVYHAANPFFALQ